MSGHLPTHPLVPTLPSTRRSDGVSKGTNLRAHETKGVFMISPAKKPAIKPLVSAVFMCARLSLPALRCVCVCQGMHTYARCNVHAKQSGDNPDFG